MALWYLNRGTGAASLILLTLTFALGIAEVRRWAPRGVPRFVLDDAHRTLALLTVSMLAIHVVAAIVDGYVSIRIVDAIVPFTGSYRPLWLGLGALGLDLLVALIVTSLLRARIGLRAWRAVHWLAYASWPVAMVHSLGIGTDTSSWLVWLAVACGAVMAAAVAARVATRGAGARPGTLAGVGR